MNTIPTTLNSIVKIISVILIIVTVIIIIINLYSYFKKFPKKQLEKTSIDTTFVYALDFGSCCEHLWNKKLFQDELKGILTIPEKEITKLGLSHPDILVCSVFGHKKFSKKYKNVPKIIISGENVNRIGFQLRYDPLTYYFITNFEKCLRFGITKYDEKEGELVMIKNTRKTNYCYTPYWCVDNDNIIEEIKNRKRFNKPKTEFCCFVVTNSMIGNLVKCRTLTFSEISKYQRVDSAGGSFNNMKFGFKAPREREKYLDWISQYKFMVCFENSLSPGYITEKITNALAANVIPIFCGHKCVFDFINQDSVIFLDYKRFFTKNKFMIEDFYIAVKELIKNEIILLNENDSLYYEKLSLEPLKYSKNGKLVAEEIKQNIKDSIKNVFNSIQK